MSSYCFVLAAAMILLSNDLMIFLYPIFSEFGGRGGGGVGASLVKRIVLEEDSDDIMLDDEEEDW